MTEQELRDLREMVRREAEQRVMMSVEIEDLQRRVGTIELLILSYFLVESPSASPDEPSEAGR